MPPVEDELDELLVEPPVELLEELVEELLDELLVELPVELLDEELEELDDEPEELPPPLHTSPVTTGTSALPPFLDPWKPNSIV